MPLSDEVKKDLAEFFGPFMEKVLDEREKKREQDKYIHGKSKDRRSKNEGGGRRLIDASSGKPYGAEKKKETTISDIIFGGKGKGAAA